MRPRALLTLAAAGGLVLLSAGCGGSGHGPGASAQASGAVAFAHCMRAHGVPAYPDPTSGGELAKKTPAQLGVSDSAFQAAQGACIHLVPDKGEPSEAQIQQYRDVMLVYAHCMRAHGVANMPDPDNRGRLDIGPGTDVDVNSAQFQAAYQACKSRLSP